MFSRSILITYSLLLVAGFDYQGRISADEPSYVFDTQKRQLWIGGKIQGSPEPPEKYATEIAFPFLRFEEPVELCEIPGSNKLCVATRRGKIYTLDADPQVKHADLLIDLNKAIFSIAFHPQFAQNGYFYVSNSARPSATKQDGAQVSRFQTSGNNLKAELGTEEVILTWPSGGHVGGCIQFGPDGKLYLATGDASGIGDELETGQDISDLSGSILRIDVNYPQAGRAYSVPSDNPFVGTPNARGEVWAFGLRHVWKFSLDRQGRMWAGDVGQDLWEAVYLVERGGNYGWSILESGKPFRPNRTTGPREISPPIAVHSHSDFRAVTGGEFHDSPKLTELSGFYVYGDFETGKICALKPDGLGKSIQLVDTGLGIVDFGKDVSGEIYVVDYVGGRIHRLIRAPELTEDPQPFPHKLSETGLFESTEDHLPAKGMMPYSVNAPLWSDNAEKQRFLALPSESKIEPDAVYYPHGRSYPEPGWRFPDGTVLVKTFSLAMDTSRSSELTRIETRVMHLEKSAGNDQDYATQNWNTYTYAWNEQQTDAELVEAEGRDLQLTILDAQCTDGKRIQLWRLPSRTECALCHNLGAKHVLGVTTLQMNRSHDFGSGLENQLEVMQRLGMLNSPFPTIVDNLPKLVDYRDERHPDHLRARAYLHANCAHCHRKWGGGNAEFELTASQPLGQINVLNALPSHGTFGLNDPRIIVAGQPERSLVCVRMKTSGLGHMPHLGSNVADNHGIAIVEQWISNLDKVPDSIAASGAINPRQMTSGGNQPINYSRLALYVATVVLVVLTLYSRLSRKLPLIDD
jgi:uncharacterized repeat protein (TIGR03806 family)